MNNVITIYLALNRCQALKECFINILLLNSHNRWLQLVPLVSPFHRHEEWGLARQGVLAKVTQQASGSKRHLTPQLILLTLPSTNSSTPSTHYKYFYKRHTQLAVVESPRCQNATWRLWLSRVSVLHISFLSRLPSPNFQTLSGGLSFQVEILHF